MTKMKYLNIPSLLPLKHSHRNKTITIIQLTTMEGEYKILRDSLVVLNMYYKSYDMCLINFW